MVEEGSDLGGIIPLTEDVDSSVNLYPPRVRFFDDYLQHVVVSGIPRGGCGILRWIRSRNRRLTNGRCELASVGDEPPRGLGFGDHHGDPGRLSAIEDGGHALAGAQGGQVRRGFHPQGEGWSRTTER